MHYQQNRQVLPIFEQTQISDTVQPKSTRHLSENL